jgi:hypothetical protein
MAKVSRVGTRENFQVSSITDLLPSVRAHRAIRGLQPAPRKLAAITYLLQGYYQAVIVP